MTLAIRVRRLLEDEIMSGVLKPGDRLDEETLARRYKVSRTPIREALMLLQGSALVERRPRGGTVVKGETLKTLVQSLELHGALEGFAGSLAARRLRNTDRTAIEAALEQCEALIDGDPDDYYDANLSFHQAIWTASYNNVLMKQIVEVGERLAPFYRAQHQRKGWIERTARDHREIVAALFSGDADACFHLFRKHVHFDSDNFADIAAQLDG